MKKGTKPAGTALREKAEQLLKTRPISTSTHQHINPSDPDILKLIHELEVHQIELELQQEELLLAKEQAELAAEKYANLYDFAPSGYFTLSADGKILELNLAGARMLGKERSRLQNSSFGFFVSRESKPVFNRFLAEVFSSTAGVTCEVALAANGDIPIVISLLGVWDESGERCLVTAVDITESRQAEELMRNMGEMLNIAPSSIIVHDTAGRILYANQKTFEIHGYTESEFMGINLHDLDVPDSEAMLSERFKLIEDLNNASFEVAHYHKDGHEIPMEVFARKVEWKGQPAILSVATDITLPKKAKEELRESEEKFREIIELSCDIHYRQNAITNELDYMSPAITHVLGYTLDEALSMNVEDHYKLFHPDDLPNLLGFMNDLLESEEKGDRKTERLFRMLHKSGEVRWINGTYFLTRDMHGEPRFVVGVLKDITTRRQADEALRESVERFRTYIEYAPDGVFISDEKGHYLEVNAAACNITGYSEDELLKLSIPDLLLPEDLEIGLQHSRNVDEKGFARGDSRFIKKDGEVRFWDVAAVKLSATRFLGFVQDITQRKRAEEELKQSQVLSKTIIDSIPATFYMIDASGKYFGWNAYQRDEIVGQPESQMAGTYAIDTIHADDREIVGAKIANVLVNGTEEVVEGRVLLRGGPNYLWFLMTGCRLMIDDSPVLIGIGIDITERKKAEEELLKKMDEMHRFHRLTVGRELKMIELKKEVNELCRQLGLDERHTIVG